MVTPNDHWDTQTDTSSGTSQTVAIETAQPRLLDRLIYANELELTTSLLVV